MNWLAIALVGTIAAWFEYSYQRSRRAKAPGTRSNAPSTPLAEAVRVEQPGQQPSISPGTENDKQANAAV
jgi:hypothetical protein